MRKSRFLPILVLGIALAQTSAVQAAEPADLIKLAFGNTVLSIYPDGRSQKIWLHPDGSWDGQSRGGSPLAGSWQVKSEKVCLRQSYPPTLPIAFCTPFPTTTRIGVAWPSKDAGGRHIQLKVVKGLVRALAGN